MVSHPTRRRPTAEASSLATLLSRLPSPLCQPPSPVSHLSLLASHLSPLSQPDFARALTLSTSATTPLSSSLLALRQHLSSAPRPVASVPPARLVLAPLLLPLVAPLPLVLVLLLLVLHPARLLLLLAVLPLVLKSPVVPCSVLPVSSWLSCRWSEHSEVGAGP